MNMMEHKISIIIPCFNCETTLEEAVESVYTQDFRIPFEIIIVDDGSKDTTPELIKKFTKRYPQITYIFHEKNKGGGAARNTGIEKATGDLIFCLDSDNVLAPKMLSKMADYLIEKKVDGVAFFERRFFSGLGHIKGKFSSHFNKIIDRTVILDDLFNGSNILLDNFLYTKKSFFQAGGYPTHHGFDTQGYEMRYLSKNLKVVICPDTIFYHRQAQKSKSYFERVYEDGLMSENFYLILEEIMHLFSKETRNFILQYDLYKNTQLNHNFKSDLDILYTKNKKNFFIEKKENYLNENGWDKFYHDFETSNSPEAIFCLAIYHSNTSQFSKALSCYIDLLEKGFDTKIIYFNILRMLVTFSGKYDNSCITLQVHAITKALNLRKQAPVITRSIITRIIKKFRKLVFKTSI